MFEPIIVGCFSHSQPFSRIRLGGVFDFQAFKPFRVAGNYLKELQSRLQDIEGWRKSLDNYPVLIPQWEEYLDRGLLRFSDYIRVAPYLAKDKGEDFLRFFKEGGNLFYRSVFHNRVVNAGLDYSLSSSLAGGSQLTTWYVGLVAGTPTFAAGDTMSSHAGWTEVTGYSESVRQTWTPGAVSSQSVNNNAAKATFSVNATITNGGAFLTSNSTKSGTTGTLFSGSADPNGNRTFYSGDTIQVGYTFSAADDGV